MLSAFIVRYHTLYKLEVHLHGQMFSSSITYAPAPNTNLISQSCHPHNLVAPPNIGKELDKHFKSSNLC
jgi:hypothetical protein